MRRSTLGALEPRGANDGARQELRVSHARAKIAAAKTAKVHSELSVQPEPSASQSPRTAEVASRMAALNAGQ